MTNLPTTPAPMLTNANADVPRLALRARDAAKAIGVSERTLFDLTRRGLPCVRLDRAILYPVDALRAWLAAQAGPSAQKATTAKAAQP